MPRYRVLADWRQFDQGTIQTVLREMMRTDPECEASFELKEGEGAWFKLVASSRDTAQRSVEAAARKAGVTDSDAVGGAEAEPL